MCRKIYDRTPLKPYGRVRGVEVEVTSEGWRLLVAGQLVASGRNASPRFAPVPVIFGAAISFINSSNLVRTERLRHRGITMGAATRRIKVARPWTALRGCPSGGGGGRRTTNVSDKELPGDIVSDTKTGPAPRC